MKQYHLISCPPRSSVYRNLMIVSESSDTTYHIEEHIEVFNKYIFNLHMDFTKKVFDIEIIDSSDSIEELKEIAMLEIL